MPHAVDVFWSFRSPYSYLATGRLVKAARDYDLTLNVRPVFPLAVRDDQFFKKVNALFAPYLIRDIVRVGEMLGIPIGWPRPDPVVQDMATKEIAADQPYIYRITRLGAAAVEAGRGLAFIDQVSRIIWDGTVDGWHQGDHLAQAAERAGLDLAALEAAVAADPAKYDRVIEENQDALKMAGHWGVPTMVFQGEPFFGQDRIDMLCWRMEQVGLARRAG